MHTCLRRIDQIYISIQQQISDEFYAILNSVCHKYALTCLEREGVQCDADGKGRLRGAVEILIANVDVLHFDLQVLHNLRGKFLRKRISFL